MTTAFTQAGQTRTAASSKMPTAPTGWPIGSYDSYAEAQRAVGHLASQDFPLTDVTIVGVEPMLVERIAGKLTLGRVLGNAAFTGLMFGLFVGLLLSLFNPAAGLLPIVTGLVAGMASSLIIATIGYRNARGRRDFFSTSQIVARRYDVLSQPRNAERGRDLLAKLSLVP